jgi:hypothetical protein
VAICQIGATRGGLAGWFAGWRAAGWSEGLLAGVESTTPKDLDARAGSSVVSSSGYEASKRPSAPQCAAVRFAAGWASRALERARAWHTWDIPPKTPSMGGQAVQTGIPCPSSTVAVHRLEKGVIRIELPLPTQPAESGALRSRPLALALHLHPPSRPLLPVTFILSTSTRPPRSHLVHHHFVASSHLLCGLCPPSPCRPPIVALACLSSPGLDLGLVVNCCWPEAFDLFSTLPALCPPQRP